MRDVNEHIATGSADCRYCPVCQVIHVVRSTSPEVRAAPLGGRELADARRSGAAGDPRRPATVDAAPVEKIDLDDDDGADWDEEP